MQRRTMLIAKKSTDFTLQVRSYEEKSLRTVQANTNVFRSSNFPKGLVRAFYVVKKERDSDCNTAKSRYGKFLKIFQNSYRQNPLLRHICYEEENFFGGFCCAVQKFFEIFVFATLVKVKVYLWCKKLPQT